MCSSLWITFLMQVCWEKVHNLSQTTSDLSTEIPHENKHAISVKDDLKAKNENVTKIELIPYFPPIRIFACFL